MTTTGVGVIGTITGTEVIGDGIAGMVPDGDGDGILGMVRAGMLAGDWDGIHGTIGMARAGAAIMAITTGEATTMADEEVLLIQITEIA